MFRVTSLKVKVSPGEKKGKDQEMTSVIFIYFRSSSARYCRW